MILEDLIKVIELDGLVKMNVKKIDFCFEVLL